MNNNIGFPSPKTPKSNQAASASGGGGSNQQQQPSGSKKKKEKDSAKKQRVLISRSNLPSGAGASSGTKSMPTTPSTYNYKQPPIMNSAAWFGPLIPEEVMENVLFRFLYNIPDNEKEDQIRICFHIEQAHWFYLDFFCPDNGDPPPQPNCKKVGFPQFVRQVFYKCDYLDKWRSSVDMVIEQFRLYKSSVPTYGVIMLDPTLNYILLIQGYFASKNSWGFPKGKINEGELPLECAIREAFEEVGFYSKDHISGKVRPLQSFIGETLVRLYLATDVPMDFPFKPHLRKEIRKIAWFSVTDLPKDRNDDVGCARLGLHANNFYSVHPFVNDICNFIQRERGERNKPKCSVLKQEGQSQGGSAFQPVIPRASSNQQLSSIISPNASTLNLVQIGRPQQMKTPTTTKKSAVENLFKPVQEPENSPLQSFTGQTFLEQFRKQTTTLVSPGGGTPSASGSSKEKDKENGGQQIPKNPAGVIGSESRRRNKDIKQPKPLHPSKLIVNVYEAPPEGQSSPESPQKQKKPKTTNVMEPICRQPTKQPSPQMTYDSPRSPSPTPRTRMMIPTESVGGGEGGGNEIVNMLRSSIGKKEQLNMRKKTSPTEQLNMRKKTSPTGTGAIASMAQIQLVPTQVRLCEAWKKFTFDKTCFKNIA